MRVYLILQILQFGLQALVFQFLQHFFIAKRLEEKFNGYIKSYHKKGNHKMNKIANCDRRIRKRNRFKGEPPDVETFPRDISPGPVVPN